MTDDEVVLSRHERDEILKAVKAIERQVKDVLDQSHWQALYVIGTNLTLIETNLSHAQRVSSN